MDKNLINKLEYLHENNQFEEIIQLILEVPEEKRDYKLKSQLARAYNNCGVFITGKSEEFIKAIELLLSIKKDGKDDYLWYYRIGFAYWSININDKALESFKKANKLIKDKKEKEHIDEIKEFIKQIEHEIKISKLIVMENCN
ncbi:hypothetical protein [Methanobrevibacter filiformis]|uniref:Tetratricopeptide repeat protein n=1 Tax=Methanobrevibacter filiformis TaxID=55758 RepID=A0A166EWA7_9EURY|nr:hypothetical protein [Methanobrevibacter filiformis]KZX17082.1 hypothetical protein MBFIL_03640 [Methanobrevibacter filiformis]